MSYNIIKQSLIPIGLSTLLFSSPAVANLVTVSPYLTSHIKRFGDYLIDDSTSTK